MTRHSSSVHTALLTFLGFIASIVAIFLSGVGIARELKAR